MKWLYTLLDRCNHDWEVHPVYKAKRTCIKCGEKQVSIFLKGERHWFSVNKLKEEDL